MKYISKIFELNTVKADASLEEIEDYFLELIDYNNHAIPISTIVLPSVINKVDKTKNNKRRYINGYKISIIFDFFDQVFVKKVVSKALLRMKRDYNIHYNQISKSGHGYTEKEVPVAGGDYTRTVYDPKWKWTITISKKNMNESKIKTFNRYNELNNPNYNLLIVDVQKSFSKFFTQNYLNKLIEYAKSYDNVYQIWDNHVEGSNIDNDYLYDKKPDIPSMHNDLYVFPNQKMLIEKRYNYNVNANFYKKILDEETYKIMKDKESKQILKRGEIFKTNEGTVIVYIGNRHVYFHCPKKLYELLLKLKGKHLTVVGGSDSECLSDVFTTCESLGVLVKRDWKYIYSATNCPIQ